MAAELFCAKCGLGAPIDEIGNLSPCVVCGNAVFVPQRYISWEAALSESDRAFLKAQKIALT